MNNLAKLLPVLGLSLLVPALGQAQTQGNPHFNSVTTNIPLAAPYGGLGASSLSGFVFANGASAATASPTIPSSSITGTFPSTSITGPASERTWSGGSNDTVLQSDQGGVVVFANGASANTILLASAFSPIVVDIVPTGSGTTILEAASGGYLNTVATGYVTLTSGVSYHITSYQSSGVTYWQVK